MRDIVLSVLLLTACTDSAEDDAESPSDQCADLLNAFDPVPPTVVSEVLLDGAYDNPFGVTQRYTCPAPSDAHAQTWMTGVSLRRLGVMGSGFIYGAIAIDRFDTSYPPHCVAVPAVAIRAPGQPAGCGDTQ